MGSRIMAAIGLWDQILPRLKSPKLLFHSLIYFEANLLIIISYLLESVCHCLKAIPLSSFYIVA
jgi:hypothetical protein